MKLPNELCTVPAKIVNGALRLAPEAKAFLLQAAKTVQKDSSYYLTLHAVQERRTTQQRRYYWSVIVPLYFGYLQENGITDLIFYNLKTGQPEPAPLSLDAAHLELLYTANLQTATGKKLCRTSYMSVSQMSAYIEACIQYLAELGVVVPPPGVWIKEKEKKEEKKDGTV